MHIIFDANTIISEYNHWTTAYKTFSRICKLRGYKLLIPRIAYLEAERRYISYLKEYLDKHQKFIESIDISHLESSSILNIEEELRPLLSSYAESIVGREVGFQVEILNNKDVDIQTALRRTSPPIRPINRIKEKPEANIRDTLIWIAILDLIDSKNGNFVFVSGDNDFSNRDEISTRENIDPRRVDSSKLALDSSLDKEVQHRLGTSGSFKYYANLIYFLDSISSELLPAEEELLNME